MIPTRTASVLSLALAGLLVGCVEPAWDEQFQDVDPDDPEAVASWEAALMGDAGIDCTGVTPLPLPDDDDVTLDECKKYKFLGGGTKPADWRKRWCLGPWEVIKECDCQALDMKDCRGQPNPDKYTCYSDEANGFLLACMEKFGPKGGDYFCGTPDPNRVNGREWCTKDPPPGEEGSSISTDCSKVCES